MAMSFPLSICVLFISLMQSVNGAQVLNNILFLLFGTAGVPVFSTVIVPLTGIYASRESHKLDFNIEVLI